jgi:glycosyltransferase involved in cell wall biosynthesis
MKGCLVFMGMMQKLLFIAPHLSTGGFPQYLLFNIQQVISTYEVYVVEYTFSSPDFVVQRNAIKELIPPNNFFTLGTEKNSLISIVQSISPDIIHWGEIPEMFCNDEITKQIYDKHRKHTIIETTHGSMFDLEQKRFFPDKFILVCEWSKQQYARFYVPIDVIEYPIIHRTKSPSIDLGFEKGRKHILNVGLFTPGKNQGEAFEIARHIPEADFHFVGNTADNFRYYWEPLLKNKPSNCILHGERQDVDKFYNCADIFLFTSKLELNPLCVKEALGWELPVLMRDLPTYCGRYNGPFLTDDIDKNIELVRSKLQ